MKLTASHHRLPWLAISSDPRPPSNPLEYSDQHIPKLNKSNGQIFVNLTLNDRQSDLHRSNFKRLAKNQIAPQYAHPPKTTKNPMKIETKYLPRCRSGAIKQ